MAGPRIRHRPRLGLRLRITLAFAASAALLSLVLAGTTWTLTRQSLINQQESAAVRQAQIDAANLASQIPLVGDPGRIETIRKALQSSSGTQPAIRLSDGKGHTTWVAPGEFASTAIPSSLTAMVAAGQSARIRFREEGTPQLAIGIAMPQQQALYFEIVPLTSLQRTLESLGVSLFGASLVTILVGAALGYWTSRRTLRPLANVGLAAEAIAGGRLDTRLEGADDPDLQVLVSSFNHMAQALEDRVERDGRFASDVSHELRSPLMTLAASVQVLANRRDEMPDDSAQAAVDLMEADVARFQQLVDDLLEISRFDAGVARLSLDEVNPAELVRQAIGLASDRAIPLEVAPELDELVIRADKRRLVRVIANLLDNAEKYGGGATSVAVDRDDDYVSISVEDAGPGVPPDERDLVFHRFARGGGAGRRSTAGEGVGLGLSLVMEHVALHGGRVRVDDRRDGEPGARFVVELPVNRA
jgi:signal transduction histidine kinase